MSERKQTPLVSVAVMAYNSAETIVETLESVKAQTYQRLELVIGDDGSRDRTVELCKTWIETNRSRFERVELLANPINQGTSANYNRVMDVCRGEWVKDLDGDDILTEDCITQFIGYIRENPNAEYIFCRVQPFCEQGGKIVLKDTDSFNYNFFALSPNEQLRHLLFAQNCIPSPGLFYKLSRVQEVGLRNDERIPLMEDWPKWINALRKGLCFSFVDKTLVMYRIGNGISTSPIISQSYYKNCCLFRQYYLFPAWKEENFQMAVDRMVKEECDVYSDFIRVVVECTQIRSSIAYRIGKIVLKPFKWLKH